MPETVIEIRNRLRRERERLRPTPAEPAQVLPLVPREHQAPPVADPQQLVIEHPDTHRVVLTTPLTEVAAITDNPSLLPLSGRLVQAEKANDNGALWSTGDLEFGLPTVTHGPLNHQHNGDIILGTITGSRMVESAAAGSHIAIDGVLWRWVHPDQMRDVENFLAAEQAWLSMECISERVQCTGPTGCGQIMPYREAALRTDKACVHVREHSSQRRMVNPLFMGAAVIVPPKTPAWADADLRVRKAGEELLETADLKALNLAESQAAGMVSTIMDWVSA